MKKLSLLLLAIIGLVAITKKPPLEAENKQNSKYANLVVDTSDEYAPLLKTIDKSLDKELAVIVKDKKEKDKKLNELVTLNKILINDNKALQKENSTLKDTQKIKPDTVFIKVVDTVKGQNYKTNIFGKRKPIKNK